MKQKMITITEKQEQYLTNNCINLSALVRKYIDLDINVSEIVKNEVEKTKG